MATVDELLIKLDATTKELRRELTLAEQAIGDMERNANRHMSRFERTFRAATTGAGQSLEAFATQLGPTGALLSRFGTAGKIAAVGIHTTAAAMIPVIRTAEQFEQAGLRTEAILKATGYASGETAESIREMSQDIAHGTLESVEGVENAAQKLLWFRSVAGDTFRRTLELSQDMAANGLGSIDTAAVLLGKALETPLEGLKSLQDIGVDFTEGQRKDIKAFAQSGQLREAQAMMLTAVEKQFGGAGGAEAEGLSGAVSRLIQEKDELLHNIDETLKLKEAATFAVDGAASAIAGVSSLFDDSARAKLADLTEDYEKLTAILAMKEDRLEGLGSGRSGKESSAYIYEEKQVKILREQVAALRQKVEVQAEVVRKEEETAAARRETAAAAAEAAWAERELEGNRPGSKASPELGASFSGTPPVLQFPALQFPALQFPALQLPAPLPDLDREQAAQERERQVNAGRQIIADLERQAEVVSLVASGQENVAAWTQEEARWRDLLGESYETMEPQIRGAWDTLQAVTEETRRHAAAMQYVEDIGSRAMDRIGSAISQAFTQGGSAAINFSSITQGILADLMQAFIELAAINPIKNALGIGGGLPVLGDLFSSIFGNQSGGGPTNLLPGYTGGSSGGLLISGSNAPIAGVQAGGLYHTGGVAGVDNMMPVHELFASAKRFHTGGFPGLRTDEVPAILQKGEGVFTEAQMRALAPVGSIRGGSNVTVNVINNAGAQVSTQQRPDGNGGMRLDVMVDQAVAKKLGTQGSASNKAIRQNFGATPVLARR